MRLYNVMFACVACFQARRCVYVYGAPSGVGTEGQLRALVSTRVVGVVKILKRAPVHLPVVTWSASGAVLRPSPVCRGCGRLWSQEEVWRLVKW